MTEPTELLPCAFCGAAAHFEMDEGRWEWVECESCGMQGNRSASLMEDCKPKLAEEWNRRTPQPTQPQATACEPDFWTVCAQYEDGDKTGWVPLPGYSNETEHGVKNLVLQAARKEGYKGTVTGRLQELGWEIRPVYLAPWAAPQPATTPQADSQPAPVRDYPPLPEPAGKIQFPAQPYESAWVSSMDAYDESQMHAFVDADRAAYAPADSVTAPAAGAVAHTLSDAQIEAMPVWRNFVGLWPESRREIVDAVVDLLAAAPTPPAQGVDSVLEDAARLDWLLLHISGAEFRRIGVHYSGNARRADVDAARKQGANHD